MPNDCIWLVSNGGDGLWSPGELMLYRVNLRLAPDWFKQRPVEWPRHAIVFEESLGLTLDRFTRKAP
jgi:hypothetical protein